jgi:hypothetical protein
MIGYAAASQSAQQVTAMLGGPPASDRRVQDQLNELLASKSRPELWEVLRLLKEFLGGDRQAASQYFSERPGLTKAVFQAQVLLGESGGRASRARVFADLLRLVAPSLIGCSGEEHALGACRHRTVLLRADFKNKLIAVCGCSTVIRTHWLQTREHMPPDTAPLLGARRRITDSTLCVSPRGSR